MARLGLHLLMVQMIMFASGRRGDMLDDEMDVDYRDSIDLEICGGAFDSGLNPECQSCDDTWCRHHCPGLETACGNLPYWQHPLCQGKKCRGCPCQLYEKKDLNISVSCTTSQSVMGYDLSKLFNLRLDASQFSINIIMKVRVKTGESGSVIICEYISLG